MYSHRLVFILFALIMLLACNKDVVYEENMPVNCHGWQVEDTLIYSAKIKDTLQAYDLSVNIRHRDVYDYMNVYLKIETILPSGLHKVETISLPLCDDAGKWYGRCTGDICFNRLRIMQKVRFPEVGTYQFRIKHEMRVDALDNILDVGFRVEKSIQKQITNES